MTGDPDHPYADFTGTGNTLHTANRTVRKLILDSLRFWVRGDARRRLPLRPGLHLHPRRAGAIDLAGPPIFAEITADPVLAAVRLIAEPWDLGGYQLGRELPGPHLAPVERPLPRRRAPLRARRPGHGARADAAALRQRRPLPRRPDARLPPLPERELRHLHDGFTLYDLVSYERKRNEANGHDNRGRTGVENSAGTAAGRATTGVPGGGRRAARSGRRGTSAACSCWPTARRCCAPGDEFLQTQGGNNNPYNQDNETSWLDWRRLRGSRRRPPLLRGG